MHRELAPEAAGDAQHLELVLAGQAIAGLDLDGGDPLGHQPRETATGGVEQLRLRSRPRRCHRRAYTAAGARNFLIARSLQAPLELAGAVAAEDDMGMAIDQARRDPEPGTIDHLGGEGLGPVRQGRARADEGDPPILAGKGAVADGAVSLAARCHGRELRVDPEPVPFRHASIPLLPAGGRTCFSGPRRATNLTAG